MRDKAGGYIFGLSSICEGLSTGSSAWSEKVVGDVVYMVDTSSKIGQSKKLREQWIGPFVIVFID